MAYKVFTNGSPLPASDLNTYLMNQSVMVFANSTARSAALTSPTEGMTTYLEDTNKVEVWTGAAWTDINDNSAAIPKSTVTTVGDLIVADGNASVTRLGIGTNGQVLSSNGTTATWVTPAGGGDKVFTQLFNGNITTGTQDFVVSGLASYDTYVVRFNNVSTTSANASFNLYPNSSFSNNFITYLVLSVDGSSRTNTFTEVDTGSLYFGNYTGSSSNSVNGYAIFQGCKGTTPLEVDFVGGTSGTLQTFSRTNVGRGIMVKSASVSSFTLTSSNNFDTGTLQIWGA